MSRYVILEKTFGIPYIPFCQDIAPWRLEVVGESSPNENLLEKKSEKCGIDPFQRILLINDYS